MKLTKYLNPLNYFKYAKNKTLNLYYSQEKTKIVHTNFFNVEMLVRANEDVGKAILANSFETAELEYIKNELTNDSVFIDIGSNTGVYSLVIASKSSDIQVHAFDPINLNTSLLASSIDINSFSNITVNKTCVGDYDGTVEFSISSDSAYSSMLDSGRKPELTKVNLPIIKLDTYIRDMGISKVDIIKIDVEGAEKLVILGASNILSNSLLRPKLMMIELFDLNLKAFKTSVKEVVDLMTLNKYQPFVLENGNLVSFNYQIHANNTYNVFFKNIEKT
jgi:FkbM family methyltransferase